EAFLQDPFAGWGEANNSQSSPVYADVAAVPSATVEVKVDENVLNQVAFQDLSIGRVIETERIRVAIVEDGRNWVATTVVDDATGQPIPCRVHFRSPDGVPYQPHGHHSHVASNHDTWHRDVGGDLRLGQLAYAYTDGRCQGWLPRGDVIVDVARGYEYQP